MKKKIAMIITIFLVVVCLLVCLLYIPYIKNNSIYVIIENNAIWRNTNGKWSNVNSRELKRMSFDKFYFFDRNNYLGESYLNYIDYIEVYDKNYQKVVLGDGALLIKSPIPLKNTKIINYYEDITESESEYIDDILSKYSLKMEDDIEVIKYIVDLNKDGEEDILYNISNFYSDEEEDQAFSIIFAVIGEKTEIIDSVIVDKSEELSVYSTNLRYVIDIDSDDNYEIMVLKSIFGGENDCYDMYKYDYNLGKFIKLIGC